jgi:hypothetical protein
LGRENDQLVEIGAVTAVKKLSHRRTTAQAQHQASAARIAADRDQKQQSQPEDAHSFAYIIFPNTGFAQTAAHGRRLWTAQIQSPTGTRHMMTRSELLYFSRLSKYGSIHFPVQSSFAFDLKSYVATAPSQRRPSVL